MVGDHYPLNDNMVGQPELKPEEQLVDLQQGEPGASEPGTAEQAELLPAPLALPAAVGELPKLGHVAAVDEPGPIPEPECTRDGPNSCVTDIAGKDLSHRVLRVSGPHEP